MARRRPVYRVTIRRGGRTERSKHSTLDEAVDALEARASDLARTERRDPIDLKVRHFDAVQQVAVRAEVAGPRRLFPAVRGGVDVRGDGSAEAYVGGVRRELVKQRRQESPYDALRRALSAATQSTSSSP